MALTQSSSYVDQQSAIDMLFPLNGTKSRPFIDFRHFSVRNIGKRRRFTTSHIESALQRADVLRKPIPQIAFWRLPSLQNISKILNLRIPRRVRLQEQHRFTASKLWELKDSCRPCSAHERTIKSASSLGRSKDGESVARLRSHMKQKKLFSFSVAPAFSYSVQQKNQTFFCYLSVSVASNWES